MARSRNIKPGFFVNPELAECSPHARLLFIGLWLVADRQGRLEDRPKHLKVQLFPCEDVNVDSLLNELHSGGFAIRYEYSGARYIQIPSFLKHQNPHKNEVESVIPAYKPNSSKIAPKPEHSIQIESTPAFPSPLPLPSSFVPNREEEMKRYKMVEKSKPIDLDQQKKMIEAASTPEEAMKAMLGIKK